MLNENCNIVKVLCYYGLVSHNEVFSKFKIVCPFHGDVNASMLIDVSSDRFFCFGCNARGDSLDFVKMMENVDSIKALLKLSEISKSLTYHKIKVNNSTRFSDAELLKKAKLYYESLSFTDWYKQKDTYIQNRGFDSKALNDVGAKVNYKQGYEVIFPLQDMNEFKGYVLRATDVSMDRKYLYNTGFSRKSSLIGIYNFDWVVITEGFLDLLKLKQFGINNSCAILGWKITDEQIKKIKQYTSCVISALDNTKTGRDGTNYLRKHFNVVRLQFDEYQKDVGELSKIQFNYVWNKTLDKINNYKE